MSQQNQRNLARDGAEKKLTVPAIVAGQKRQTTGELHGHLHGQAVDDAVPVKTFSKPVPLHPSTTARQRAGVDASNDPKAILRTAAALGRKA
jgi:hypothetical protein